MNYSPNKKNPVLDETMVYGKVPPQSKELEEAVLGAIMLERDAFDKASDVITGDCFYVDAHQRIFRAMEKLNSKRSPIDMLTVVEALKSTDELETIGGAYYLVKLTNTVVSTANVETHARIIMQKFLMRELIRIGGAITTKAYDESTDVFDLLDIAEESVSGLRMRNIRKNFKTLRKVMAENIQALEQLRLKDESITGVESGFPELDKVTNGWQATDLIILAARPAVGKTAFALTLVKNAARSFVIQQQKYGGKKKGVGFFSLEMNDRQLVNRMLSSESDIWLWRFNNGRLNDDQMQEIYNASEKMSELEIFIDETAALKISEFKAKARMMVRKFNVGLIVVDYLQLMKDPAKKMREQEIASISSQLKEMAKELDIPIIALSQLNREFGKPGTGVREPQLSDIRESGAIEQDADMVMMLFKPSDAEIDEDAELGNIFYNKIVKFRNGNAPVKFIGKFAKETQSHEWLKVVDGKTMNPLGDNWKPVPEDYESKVSALKSKQTDMPF